MSSTRASGSDPPSAVAPLAEATRASGQVVALRPGILRTSAIDDLLSVYDSMGLGAVVLSAGSRIVGLNARAGACFDGVLAVLGGCLAAISPANEQKLEFFLGRTSSSGQRAASPEVVTSLARPGRRPLILRGLLGERVANAPRPIIMLIVDPEAQPCPSPATLAETFGLTSRECAVALNIVRGRTIKKIAQTRNILPDTVRAQVKSVFKKTGTRQQSELVTTLICLGHFVRGAPNG